MISDLSSFQRKWQIDISDLDDEDWTEIWDMPFKQLVSVTDRLIQFKRLHRAYYTLYRLQNLNLVLSSAWWNCRQPKGDFFHIIMICPDICQNWQKIIEYVNAVTLTCVSS